MKLKTQLVGYRIATFPAKNEKRPEGDSDEMVHDAAAAHALMQAMGEIEGSYADCSPANDIRQFLTERADELMRKWGYEQERVG